MIKKTKKIKYKKQGGNISDIDSIIKSQSSKIKSQFIYKNDDLNKIFVGNDLKKYLLTNNKHKQIDRVTKVYNQYLKNCCKKKHMLKNAHDYYVKLYKEYKRYINIILNSHNNTSTSLYKTINNLISNLSNKKIISKNFIEKSISDINNTRNDINRLKDKFKIENFKSDNIVSDSLASFDKDRSLSDIIDKLIKIVGKDEKISVKIDPNKSYSNYSNIGSKSYIFGGSKKKLKNLKKNKL